MWMVRFQVPYVTLVGGEGEELEEEEEEEEEELGW